MSIWLIIFIIICNTMLSTSISILKNVEPVSSRRGVLIQMLKNSEKQAKNDEKIQFLTACRKTKITPNFITNCLKTSVQVLGNTKGMRTVHNDYLRRTLNEVIKSSHRYRAFLLREHKRLSNESNGFDLHLWCIRT